MDRVVGGPIDRLVDAMRFRVARQSALAANVVNADTPGYRRVDVQFQDVLERKAGELTRTDEGHLSVSAGHGHRLVRGPRGSRPDGNGVDRDQELIQLSRNASAFGNQATVLARLLALQRIAATGENR